LTDDTPQDFHAAFEDRFRGSRDEVSRRLSIYLPLLEQAGVGAMSAPVLDLGCGRCEWLTMLAEAGYATVGLDLDEDIVLRARALGFEAVCSDALEYLKDRQDGSFAAVTAFHVIEHVSARVLADLIAEIHRVLLPGGLVILETPNPENITVSASTFHLDPEHVRPVPPHLADFFAHQAGFSEAWIARVNADVLGPALPDVDAGLPGAMQINAAVALLNRLYYVAPDYALLAQKAGGEQGIQGSDALEGLVERGLADLEEGRRVAAEDQARRLEAEAAENARRAEALAAEAAQLRAAAELADARASQLGLQFAIVESSASWRVTAPLRALTRLARAAGPAPDSPRTPKTYAKLVVGHPMRWVLAQPRLGPAADRRLAMMPFVDRKVRIALHEVELARAATAALVDPSVPADLRAITVSARAVFEDLEREICRPAG
jgi:O-antigen chain-terminating methyltransferase